MALVIYSTTTEILVCFALILISIIIVYYKRAYGYWKRKDVPEMCVPTFPFGSIGGQLIPSVIDIGSYLKQIYNKLKDCGHQHGGFYIFTQPMYMPLDTEYIKNILQRDFNNFIERSFYYNEKDDPLSANLFAIGGEKWRILRTKLSPAFTSGKLKNMFDNLLKCGNQMKEAMDVFCENKQEIDMKDVCESFTMDVIGSCAFGVECNCFKHPDAEFKKYGRKIFAMSILRCIKISFAFSLTKIARFLGVRLFDAECTNFFVQMVKDTVQFRETNHFRRKDILQLLLELRNDSKTNETIKDMTIEELTAQVFIFFAAGFETSSTTLSFCLYELALNTDIQNKLRDEIDQILLKHGKMTYDVAMDMKYMNQVVDETLRKYPPVSYVSRVCTNDYTIPGTQIVLEKGTPCTISILGLHHDTDFYPASDKFDPERFSEENKKQRRPFTYLPFGEGPRICIGLRFGLMQVKVGLMVLLRHYKFSLNKKTKVPLEIEPLSFTFIPKHGIFLDVEKVVES